MLVSNKCRHNLLQHVGLFNWLRICSVQVLCISSQSRFIPNLKYWFTASTRCLLGLNGNHDSIAVMSGCVWQQTNKHNGELVCCLVIWRKSMRIWAVFREKLKDASQKSKLYAELTEELAKNCHLLDLHVELKMWSKCVGPLQDVKLCFSREELVHKREPHWFFVGLAALIDLP